MAQMVELYKNDPDVEYAEPNYVVNMHGFPNDPYYSYQWNLHGSGSGGINMARNSTNDPAR